MTIAVMVRGPSTMSRGWVCDVEKVDFKMFGFALGKGCDDFFARLPADGVTRWGLGAW